MEKILLQQNIQSNITIIPNEFIDTYMVKADGEFVKIYLLLVRLINQGAYTGPDQLADLLELTVKDVKRALTYWVNQGLLALADQGNLPQESTLVSSLPDSSYQGTPAAAIPVQGTPVTAIP
ncbi:MAG: DNA replication protein DnaD, partial [Eubacterium sp.]|nr:DNA replication protein DnaD [Eubacterium sp.]